MNSFRTCASSAARTALKSSSPLILSVGRSAPTATRFTSATPSRPFAAALTAARSFHSSTPHWHGGKGRPKPGEGVTITFKKSTGEVIETVQANVGDDIVDVSWEYDLDIEAACEKSVACSTCHVYLEEDVYDRLEEPSDDENDMLDLAFSLSDTSRLGCQVKVEKWMDGTTITLPSATRNLRVDGSKPTPH